MWDATLASQMSTTQERTDFQTSREQRSQRTHELFRLAQTCLTEEERRAALGEVIELYLDYAHAQAARFRFRGVALEDLRQVAALALTKAAQRYDVDSGHDFMSFAAPTIRGELRKHFRDHGWMIRPTRHIQEVQAQISDVQAELAFELGRSPRPTEVAERLDLPLETVIEALTTDGCFAPASLDHPVGEDGSSSLGEMLSSEDRDAAALEARMLLRPVLGSLADRDRLILSLRFDEGLTQREIAEHIGVTQTQVSRLLSRILAQLRHRIGTVAPG